MKEFARYVALNILGMLGLSCYILADTFFIANGIGVNALAALNLALPVYSLIHGCGLMLGIGGSTRYAYAQARGDSPSAHIAFTHAIRVGAGMSAAFMLAGALFPGLIARLLGADESTLPMSRVYLQTILLFSPAFLLNEILLCFSRCDGAPGMAMLAMIGGSLSNIALDGVMILLLHGGMFGAALATGIAPLVSMAILLPFLAGKKRRFRAVRCRFQPRLASHLLSCGASALVTELSSGVVMLTCNTAMLKLSGNTGVAAYGVIANLSLVVTAVYTGVAQGIQPLVSRAYGRGQISRVHSVLRYALVAVWALSVPILAAVWIQADAIALLFNAQGDPLLQAIAVPGLKTVFSGCAFSGMSIVLCSYFASIDVPQPAGALSILRGVALIVPLIPLFSHLAGIRGLWLAFPVTECIAFLIGWALLRRIGPAVGRS